MRLFAGIPLSAEACDRLTSLRLRLSAPRDGLRWSAPEQWHITLQFYGQVEEARVPSLVDHLGKLNGRPAEVCLEHLGSFPSKGILHVAVGTTPSLLSLQESVVHASIRCGFLPESRPFRPHITMARSKGRPGNTSLQGMSSPKLPAFGPDLRWCAPEFLLYESKLRRQGSEYAVVARFPLLHSLTPARAE